VSEPTTEEEIGLCSYCEAVQPMEPEHVVPRAIFVNANQSTIVIPACHRCNNEKSAGEDDLRDSLVIEVGVHRHPDILPLMSVMAESTGKGFSKYGHAAAFERKPVIRRTASGVDVLAYEVHVPDANAMRRTLRYMVRGLYFHENGRPWLLDKPLTLHDLPAEELEFTLETFGRLRPFEFRGIMGNDVFKYAAITQEQYPDITAWLMVFFGTIPVLGITGIPERERERQEPTFEEIIRGKGRRERKLKRIVDRGLVQTPPEDFLGFLRRFEERKHSKTPPG
jgi:hypothetical protein